MLNKWLGTLATAAMLMGAAPAHAELIDAKNPQLVADLLKSQALPAEFKSPAGETPYIESAHNSQKFLVLLMNCDDAKRNCKTIQFYMGYNDAKKTSLEKLNDWNREKRFARAYRDKEGDPVLEMDVDLDFNGIPRENVGEAVNTWKALMEAFQAHIHGK